MFNNIYKAYTLRFGIITRLRFLTFCYIGAVSAALFTASTTPTVGASGMIFFMLGVYLMLYPTMRTLMNYIYVVIAVIISIFFGKSNVALHIMSFIFGCLFVIAHIAYDERRNQIDKYEA